MTTFLDTSAAIALLDVGDQHHQWAETQFITAKIGGPVIISDVVYSEWSVSMASQAEIDAAVQRFALERIRVSNSSLFYAGKAFHQYKKTNKGPKLGVLPDFFVGAIAETEGAPLITANPKDFVSYFPRLQIIRP